MKNKYSPILLAACVLLSLALAGCSESTNSSSFQATVTVTATTTDDTLATNDDVVSALNQYAQYWIAVREGSNKPEGERGKYLGQFITQQLLPESLRNVKNISDKKQKVTGQIVMRPQIVTATKERIVITDCQDLSATQILNEKGDLVTQKKFIFPRRIGLVKENSLWKIDSLEKDTQACSNQ